MPFMNEFEIKNVGQKRVKFRFSCNKHFILTPLEGEVDIDETVKVRIKGCLSECRSYTGRVKVYYDDHLRVPDLIPLKIKIMKDYYLSTYKLTVDQTQQNSEVSIYNFNQMNVKYHWTFKEDKVDEVCGLEPGDQAVAYHLDMGDELDMDDEPLSPVRGFCEFAKFPGSDWSPHPPKDTDVAPIFEILPK